MSLSPRDQVRLLIADTNPVVGDRLFSDIDLDAFLSIESDSVKLAAAQALDTMATNEAMVQKVIRLLDLQTNGPAVSAVLSGRAMELRRQAYELDPDGQFDWAEMVTDPHTELERMWGEWLRVT
jgi:hypothetical protein